jgi:hypothetical protein
MRRLGATESLSISAAAKTRAVGSNPRIDSREAHTRIHLRLQSLLADRFPIPVSAEIFAKDRGGYALVGSGIPLAVVALRAAGATQGDYRLNEETA